MLRTPLGIGLAVCAVLALTLLALAHFVFNPRRNGRWTWLVAVVALPVLGPLLYLLVGRRASAEDWEDLAAYRDAHYAPVLAPALAGAASGARTAPHPFQQDLGAPSIGRTGAGLPDYTVRGEPHLPPLFDDFPDLPELPGDDEPATVEMAPIVPVVPGFTYDDDLLDDGPYDDEPATEVRPALDLDDPAFVQPVANAADVADGEDSAQAAPAEAAWMEAEAVEADAPEDSAPLDEASDVASVVDDVSEQAAAPFEANPAEVPSLDETGTDASETGESDAQAVQVEAAASASDEVVHVDDPAPAPVATEPTPEPTPAPAAAPAPRADHLRARRRRSR